MGQRSLKQTSKGGGVKGAGTSEYYAKWLDPYTLGIGAMEKTATEEVLLTLSGDIVGYAIKLYTGQTANAFEIRDSSNNLLGGFNAAGAMFYTGGNTGQVWQSNAFGQGSWGIIPFRWSGSQNWTYVMKDNLSVPSLTDSRMSYDSVNKIEVIINAQATDWKNLVLKMIASQTADPFQIQDSIGTIIFKVDINGRVTCPAFTMPTGAALNRFFLSDANGNASWGVIPNDTITEPMLSMNNAPTNAYVIGWNAGGSYMEWIPQSGGGLPSLSQYVRIFDDFFSALLGDGMIGQQPWDVVNSGTGSGVSLVITDAAYPGVCQMATGTTTTGYACIILGGNVAMVFGGGEQLEFNFYIAALADATNDYECRMGFLDDVTVDPAEGAYFEYDRDTSANWLICAADNSVRTKTASGIAVATGWHRYKIVVNSNATSIEYFVDDVSLGTVTTNIPKTATRCFGIGFSNVKEAGTTTRLFYTDYMDFRKTLTTPR